MVCTSARFTSTSAQETVRGRVIIPRVVAGAGCEVQAELTSDRDSLNAMDGGN